IALLDRESLFPEQRHEILRGLDLLKAELAEAEDLVDHLLSELGPMLDVGHHLLLEGGDPLRFAGSPVRESESKSESEGVGEARYGSDHGTPFAPHEPSAARVVGYLMPSCSR